MDEKAKKQREEQQKAVYFISSFSIFDNITCSGYIFLICKWR